jgi:hypothetical protein
MGQRIDGATAIGYASSHDRESPYFAEEGLDYRRLLDDLTGASGRSVHGCDPHPGHIWLVGDEGRISRGNFRSARSPASGRRVAGPSRRCAMTSTQTHRRMRNRLLVGIALFVYLALLTVWEIDTIRMAPLEPASAFILGVLLGAATATGFVVLRVLVGPKMARNSP